ncbi:MAG: MBL fold metallo-hydrolase [Nitrospinaceae bacterium]|nr:MBL fold metallo-hydrolase [Nitrospinaceae bacterium]MBT3433861.1 MBL fold metallo-hydrolase [Nitrospinaceae bacterium]MBT3820399.1 MBL fold metallo-hydrolase [Nitrospinaceae bacterium]MBT4095437.1 MBL fold metallo-hydrolase [Nitrospinaceae bacterium]MBT4429002.1 MBL fold metallo-hydrolase [Nitrospinaceae bacterium]
MIIERIPVGSFQMNSYIVGCEKTGEGIYIDPGAEVDRVIAFAKEKNLRLSRLIGTHAHIDHAEGVAEAKQKLDIPFLLHEAELFNLQSMPDVAKGYGFPVPDVPDIDDFLIPGEFLEVGDISFEIRLTDGHAPGNISLYWPGTGEGGHVIVGDSLFAGSIGRTDLYMGSVKTLLSAIHTQLLTLPPDTVVYPGHGPETTIGHEKATNPFCQPGAESNLQ